MQEPKYVDVRRSTAPGARRRALGWLVRTAAPALPPLAGACVCKTLDKVAELGLLGLGVVGLLRLLVGADPSSMGPLAAWLVGLVAVKAGCRLLDRFLRHVSALRTRRVLGEEDADVEQVVAFLGAATPAVAGVLAPTVAVIVLGLRVAWPLAGILALGLALVLWMLGLDELWSLFAAVTALVSVAGMAVLGAAIAVDTLVLAGALSVAIRAIDLTQGVWVFVDGLDAALASGDRLLHHGRGEMTRP